MAMNKSGEPAVASCDREYQPSEMLNSIVVAEIIGISHGRLRQWRQNQIPNQPKYYKIGGLVKYRYSDLMAWLESVAVDHSVPTS